MSLLESEEDKASDLEEQVRELEGQNAFLRSRINELEARFRDESDDSIDQEVALPATLKKLQPWVQQNFLGRILLTGRAARAAKESPFQNVELACNAIRFLGNEYRNMRLKGDDASRAAYEARLQELGLENSRSGNETRLQKQGDEFYVKHRNRKRFLKNHLKDGNSRESRYCFRCYYFWDDETEQVVIGSLPGHLQTGIS